MTTERLEAVAAYAADLAAWKRQQRQGELERRRADEEVEEEEVEELDERESSTDPEDYEDVPKSGVTYIGSDEKAMRGRTSISRQLFRERNLSV